MARKSTKKSAAKRGAKKGGTGAAQKELDRVLAKRRELQAERETLRQKRPGAHQEIQALTTELEQLSARATDLFREVEG